MLALLQSFKGDKKIVCWVSRLLELLHSSVRDIRICMLSYADLIRCTPLIYLFLANKTKEGFNMQNLFNANDGSFRSHTDFKKVVPFWQMGRLMQVILKKQNSFMEHNTYVYFTIHIHFLDWNACVLPTMVRETGITQNAYYNKHAIMWRLFQGLVI